MVLAVDWARVLELAVPGGVVGVLGWWSGHRQGKVAAEQKARDQELQSAESEGNRALAEAKRVSEEWDNIQKYWTQELQGARAEAAAARKGEDECVSRYRVLWQWAVKIGTQWNALHPEKAVEVPNNGGMA